MDSLKSYKEEHVVTRTVLFEKCKKHDFENYGLKYWHNKKGDVVRIDDANGTFDLSKLIGFKGSSFLDVGYIFSPYIPVDVSPEITVTNLITSANLISRYSIKNVANYVVFSPEDKKNLPDLI
jgi:hypothetical protein